MKVLVLAGTGEARVLCQLLAAESGIEAQASLAGVTARPERYAVEVRTGGFGGAQGLVDALDRGGFNALIDATHPFADVISANACAAAEQTDIAFLRLMRPEWASQPGWQHVQTVGDALAKLPSQAVAFLATGSKTLHDLHRFQGRESHLRVVDQPTRPYPATGGFVVGKPPFAVEDEVASFTRLGITHLVAKNAGGEAGVAKLQAARVLGLQVVMVDRPPLPSAPEVATPRAALDWLRSVATGP